MKIGEKPMRTSVKLVLGDSFFNFHFVDTGFLLKDGENKHVLRKPVHCVVLWVVRGRRIQTVDNLFDVELNVDREALQRAVDLQQTRHNESSVSADILAFHVQLRE